MNVSPVNGQSAVDRYATNGATLAGSHTSNPSSGGFTTSPRPGVASVRPGARPRARSSSIARRSGSSSLAHTCENVAMPDLAAS